MQADGAQVAPAVAAASAPSPSSAPDSSHTESDISEYRRIVASLQARIAACAVVALSLSIPPLILLLRFTIVLQAAAAARIIGKDDIFKAAKDGNLQLVQDHVAADPASVQKRDNGYDSHPYTPI